jgi:hypothetical protein
LLHISGKQSQIQALEKRKLGILYFDVSGFCSS